MNGERSTADHAEGNKPRWRGVAGMLRRMVVTLTGRGRWQLRGFRDLAEVVADVEVFQAIGLWARPPAPSSPSAASVEAIVLNLGDSDAPVVIALRDERTRAAVAAALDADTTLLYNSAVRVELTPAGLLELRSHGGIAAALARLADLEQLGAIIAAIPPAVDPTVEATLVIIRAAFSTWSPTGTSRVRAE